MGTRGYSRTSDPFLFEPPARIELANLFILSEWGSRVQDEIGVAIRRARQARELAGGRRAGGHVDEPAVTGGERQGAAVGEALSGLASTLGTWFDEVATGVAWGRGLVPPQLRAPAPALHRHQRARDSGVGNCSRVRH